MSKFSKFFLSGGICLSIASPASAHVGHLGELAGHAHWVGVAALGAAALVATVAAKAKRKSEAQAEDASEDETTATPEAEPANS